MNSTKYFFSRSSYGITCIKGNPKIDVMTNDDVVGSSQHFGLSMTCWQHVETQWIAKGQEDQQDSMALMQTLHGVHNSQASEFHSRQWSSYSKEDMIVQTALQEHKSDNKPSYYVNVLLFNLTGNHNTNDKWGFSCHVQSSPSSSWQLWTDPLLM